jgi:hypothetical protein
MIPHAEFERAINQWKIRQQGGQVVSPAGEVASGAVVGEMPLANAEPGYSSGEASSDEPGRGSLSGEFDTEG